MGGSINSGDTAFVLICAALVALMTPGLAFFYGGLVRRKNFLAIMMQSFISMGVVTSIWVFFGYSLAFSGDIWRRHRQPRLGRAHGVGQLPGPWAPNIPAQAHFVYQEMFAIITPALITGAFADRVKFKSYLWFLVLWSILVYIPFVHWIWGGGLLAQQGVLDFAGGLVVHVSAGFAALASVFVVGKRKFGKGERGVPHNIAFVALGHRPAVVRLVRLQRAARRWPPTASPPRPSSTPTSPARSPCAPGCPSPGGRTASRAWSARSPARWPASPASRRRAGYVPTWSAFVFGLLAGSGCYFAVRFKDYMKWDDALDVWACHGVGGVIGTILLGVFALKSVNPAGADGLIAGNWTLLRLAGAGHGGHRRLRVRRHVPHPQGHQRVRLDPRAGRGRAEGLDDGEFGETAYNLDLRLTGAGGREARPAPGTTASGRGRKGAAPPARRVRAERATAGASRRGTAGAEASARWDEPSAAPSRMPRSASARSQRSPVADEEPDLVAVVEHEHEVAAARPRGPEEPAR